MQIPILFFLFQIDVGTMIVSHIPFIVWNLNLKPLQRILISILRIYVVNNFFKQIVNICLFSQLYHNDTSNNKNEEFKNYEGYFSFIPNDLKGPLPISNIPSSSFNQTMDLIK